MVKKKANKNEEQAAQFAKNRAEVEAKAAKEAEEAAELRKAEEAAKEQSKPQEPKQDSLMIEVPGFTDKDILLLECTCTVCGSKMMWPVPKTIGQSVMYITGCKNCGGL